MSQKSKEESVLTIKEVALYLKVTERTIYRLAGAKLKAYSSRALTNGFALLSAFTFSVSCLAGDVIQGRVVSVSDGDTITLLDADHQQHKIRLSGIDAPEKAQPFGQRSKENLSRLIFGRDVAVEWRKKDRYGRTVGKLWSRNPPAEKPPAQKYWMLVMRRSLPAWLGGIANTLRNKNLATRIGMSNRNRKLALVESVYGLIHSRHRPGNGAKRKRATHNDDKVLAHNP